MYKNTRKLSKLQTFCDHPVCRKINKMNKTVVFRFDLVQGAITFSQENELRRKKVEN